MSNIQINQLLDYSETDELVELANDLRASGYDAELLGAIERELSWRASR